MLVSDESSSIIAAANCNMLEKKFSHAINTQWLAVNCKYMSHNVNLIEPIDAIQNLYSVVNLFLCKRPRAREKLLNEKSLIARCVLW